MPTDTIRPTAHTVKGGAVQNPTQGYNGNAADWATIGTATTGTAAQLDLHTFAADTSPSSRTAVLLKVTAGWGTTDSLDQVRVYFRKTSSDPWTQVLSDAYPNGWGAAPSGVLTQQVDVTALAGSEPSSNWQVAVQFYNGTIVDPDPPTPT